ncbi:hypothetical protein [Shinella sp.]|uniref:hypothetical protein n=1 Tax=Shinella sp. TaxID=1870904 RepID=UPI0039E6ED17
MANRDPATVELARRAKAQRVRLARYLASRPVIQVKDLWVEAGLGADRYADSVYMAAHHAEKLLDIGYRPVVVPAMSGAANVMIFVRKSWPVDRVEVHPRLLPYLEDGDPLMALLVGRVQREMELAGTIAEESGHGRTR